MSNIAYRSAWDAWMHYVSQNAYTVRHRRRRVHEMNRTQIIENYENTFKVSITSDLTLEHHDEVDKFTAVT